jgi:hypothetical protein
MILRIDDDVPILWRDPRSIQFGGIRPLAIVDDVGRTQLALIEALRRGVIRSALDVIALETGGDDRDVDILLATIEPALRMHAGAPPGGEGRTRVIVDPIVAIDGGGSVASGVAEALAELGCRVLPVRRADTEGPQLAVLIADYAIAPARQARWMRRDVPHLAVVMHDAGATVGPLVEPGAGPCLRCVDLARRDADPAWPTVASQLLGRAAPHRPAVVRMATATTAAVVDGRLHRGEHALTRATVDIMVDRESRIRQLDPHPECGCRSPEGTVTALAGPAAASPVRTSSAPAAAVPA